MRTLVTLLLLAGALYAAACGAVLLLQRSMIYYPQPAAGRPPERLRLDVDGARVLVRCSRGQAAARCCISAAMRRTSR